MFDYQMRYRDLRGTRQPSLVIGSVPHAPGTISTFSECLEVHSRPLSGRILKSENQLVLDNFCLELAWIGCS